MPDRDMTLMSELWDRGWAAVLLANVALVVTFSTVDIDLWFVEGRLAEALTVGYMVALVSVIVRPSDYRTHAAALVLGIYWWVGRGFGFGERAANGATNLWGSAWGSGVTGTLAVVMLSIKSLESIGRPPVADLLDRQIPRRWKRWLDQQRGEDDRG